MANEFYSASGVPATLSQGSSSAIRDQFTLTQQAFDKLPTMTGGGNLPIFVNASGTALVTTSVSDARGFLDAQEQFDSLDSIGALTTLADRMIYTTALDTYAVATLTPVARSFLAATTVAAEKSALGLGTADTPEFAGLTLSGIPVTMITASWGAVENSDSTLVAANGVNVDTSAGDVVKSLPSPLVVGSVFQIHRLDASDTSNVCRISANGNTITSRDVAIGGDLIIENGETAVLVATSTSKAEII